MERFDVHPKSKTFYPSRNTWIFLIVLVIQAKLNWTHPVQFLFDSFCIIVPNPDYNNLFKFFERREDMSAVNFLFK